MTGREELGLIPATRALLKAKNMNDAPKRAFQEVYGSDSRIGEIIRMVRSNGG